MTAKLTPTMQKALRSALRLDGNADLVGQITDSDATVTTLRALARRNLVTLDGVGYEREYATHRGRTNAGARRFGVEVVATLTPHGWKTLRDLDPTFFASLAHKVGTVAAQPLSSGARPGYTRSEIATMKTLGWITIKETTPGRGWVTIEVPGWRAWFSSGKTLR